MPARVIREEILSSDSLSQVSLEADLLFRSLILVADDFGRLDGRVAMVRLKCFPLRSSVTEKKVTQWLAELTSIPGAPPIRCYAVEGRPYIQLTGWEKHRGKSRRASKSKFPEEPEEQINASPEIPGDPGESGKSARGYGGGSEGMEMESRGIPGNLPEIPAASPPAVSALQSTRKILKPERFEGEARDEILAWSQKRFGEKYGRILDEGFQRWESWGPRKDFTRPLSSWVGSFKTVVNGAIRDGDIKLETEDEKYRRELNASPILRAVGGSDAE